MVHLETLERLRRHYKENERRYVTEHPSEYVLLEPLDFSGVKESFFEKESDLEKAVSKYSGLCGPTFEHRKIPPADTHKFNPDNETLYITKKYTKYCPNDNKTRLPNGQIWSHNWLDEEGRHREEWKEATNCPDCNCEVFRRPEQKRINETKKRRKERITK